MAYITNLYSNSLSNQDIHATRLIGTFTNTTRMRKIYINVFADQVAGNGDYKCSITVQRSGAGSFYQSIITTNTLASGVTSAFFNFVALTVGATDVVKVYLLGLAGDTTTPDIVVDVNEEFVNVDSSGNVTVGDYASGKVPLQPTTAGRTLDVTTTGEAGLDFNNIKDAAGAHTLTNITVPTVTGVTNTVSANLVQIDGAATNGNNATLKLKALDIENPDDGGAAITIYAPGANATAFDIEAGNGNPADRSVGIYLSGTGKAITVVSSFGDAIDIIGGFAGNGDGIKVTGAGTGHDINLAGDGAIHGTVDVIETLLDSLMGVGWTTETLVALQVAINSRLAAAAYTTPPTVTAISDQVWDEAIAGHLTAGSTGAALNAAGAVSDPLANPVPGSYATGTAGAVLGAINPGKVTLISPISTDGNTIELVHGDDYLDADGRAIVWTDSAANWPNLAGATVKFKSGSLSVVCTIVPGTHQQVKLELTNAQTNQLRSGRFDLEATLNNISHSIITLVTGGNLVMIQDV